MLQNIEQVRGVGDWARAYLWDTQFPDAPVPFNEWFPANDLEEQLAVIENHTMEFFQSTYEIPRASQARRITLTFYDNATHALENWFKDWIRNGIFNGGTAVTPLEGCVRDLRVRKLTPKKETLQLTTYSIFPTGDFSYRGSSDSAPLIFSLGFVIAGTVSD